MKKIFKILGYIFLGIIVLVSGLLIYVKTVLPNVGAAPDIKISYTPEKIERGRYLANYVTAIYTIKPIAQIILNHLKYPSSFAGRFT